MMRSSAFLLSLLLFPASYCLESKAEFEKESAPRTQPAEDAYQEALGYLAVISPNNHVRPTPQRPSLSRYVEKSLRALFVESSLFQGSSSSYIPHGELSKAKELLHFAASQDHLHAVHLLADMNFFGNYSSSRNLSQAFSYYSQLARLNGSSSAQHMIGFFYATGVGNVVPVDQARALLYYTFSASQGNERAEMALAYRYHHGIGTPRDCHIAVEYWQKLARRAIKYVQNGPPGNNILRRLGYRISDDHGGVYGEGASVSSSGFNAKSGPANSDTHASHGDVIEWLDMLSRKGDVKATFSLGKMHFEGAREMKPNYTLAKRYFLEVARQYWTKSGRKRAEVSALQESLAARAAGFLGWLFMRGEGTDQNLEVAKKWFRRGIALGNSQSQYAMGLLYLDGISVPKKVRRAAELFSAAADQDNSAAQVATAKLYLDAGDVQTALKYLDLAARKGHIEALYYLGETEKTGIGQEPSCELASHHFRLVTERSEPLVASFAEANRAFESGNVDLALLDYMLAAEQGFEVAQTNVAYLLDKTQHQKQQQQHQGDAQHESYPQPYQEFLRFPVLQNALHLLRSRPWRSSKLTSSLSPYLALLYWTRSARQSNVDALVKMGDYYLIGKGTSLSADKAAACYQAAAETLQSGQALWNLGWIYENGLGGHEQDFHLAKRFYDQALEINKEAYLPVTLALFKLRMRSRWNSWTRGSAKSIQDEPRKRRQHQSIKNWISEFLAAETGNLAARADSNELEADWERDAANLADLTEEEIWEELVLGLFESIAILSLAGMLIMVLIYRRQRADRRVIEQQHARLAGQRAPPPELAPVQPQESQQTRRNNTNPQDAMNSNGIGHPHDNETGNENDRGLFPGQADTEFIDWTVGGIGH